MNSYKGVVGTIVVVSMVVVTGCTMPGAGDSPQPPVESADEAVAFAKQNESVSSWLANHNDAKRSVKKGEDTWKIVWSADGLSQSKLTVTVDETTGNVTHIQQLV